MEGGREEGERKGMEEERVLRVRRRHKARQSAEQKGLMGTSKGVCIQVKELEMKPWRDMKLTTVTSILEHRWLICVFSKMFPYL